MCKSYQSETVQYIHYDDTDETRKNRYDYHDAHIFYPNGEKNLFVDYMNSIPQYYQYDILANIEKAQKEQQLSTQDILNLVITTTANFFRLLPFNNTSDQKLSACISFGEGSSVHHAALNAYFISRLVEDKILKGTPFVWQEGDGTSYVMFKTADRYYLVDSYDKKRGFPSKETMAAMEKAHPTLKHNELTFDELKRIIETQPFPVRTCYFEFFSGGKLITVGNKERRIPHRMYEIYNIINDTSIKSGAERWRQIIEQAKDALDNPDNDRDPKTTEFYEALVEGNLSEIYSSVLEEGNSYDAGTNTIDFKKRY